LQASVNTTGNVWPCKATEALPDYLHKKCLLAVAGIITQKDIEIVNLAALQIL